MPDILASLRKLDDTRHDEIERWFAARRAEAAPFFYTSVDLRHSGFRLAPVDTNLYPAGFNNLSPMARGRASRFIARFFAEHYPQAKRILIIPENHTRNLHYLENLTVLLSLFEGTGLEAQLGSLIASPGQPTVLEVPDNGTLTEYPLLRSNGRLTLENSFAPDAIILNNDMTAGPPEILRGIAQPVLPPVAMGWWQRRKSVHFAAYQQLANDFGAQFGLDSWLICPHFHRCGIVDFKERTGLDCVAAGVEKVLAAMRARYKEYGITDEPYVYIKAESGTYGMGVMTARTAEDVLEINKKERNKMQVIKEGAKNSDVIIQEGIPTADTVSDKPAEPMVYMIDGIPVG
ncbi:MAG: glutamate--cysteine ligase, partial [Pseudomonadota bacterium]|nr:glutamate--cysteine ligase [Pseudomonadota bacterium]